MYRLIFSVNYRFYHLTSPLHVGLLNNGIQTRVRLFTIKQLRMTKPSSRILSSPYVSKASALEENGIFNEIFRFPGVKIGYFLHKLKWFQTVAVSLAVPASAFFYFVGIIDSSWMLGIVVPGVLITLNLYGVALMFHNAVGFMYLSKDGNTLKVSYLDYWGKRIDKEVAVNDVVPFLDAPRPPTDYVFKQILFYSAEQPKPKIFLKLGKITDSEKFEKVFGAIE